MSRDDHGRHDRELDALRQARKEQTESNHVSLSRKDFFLLLIGYIPALLGLYADDNTLKNISLCALLVIMLIFCIVYRGSILWRIVGGFVCVVVLSGLIYRGEVRERSKIQDEVYSKLTVAPFLPATRNLSKFGITVTNNGSSEIREHVTSCWIRRITVPNGEFAKVTPPPKSNLKAYGDAETTFCASGFVNAPITCADIIVTVSYSLSAEPDVVKIKKSRFVLASDDDQFHQQPIEYSGDYCYSNLQH